MTLSKCMMEIDAELVSNHQTGTHKSIQKILDLTLEMLYLLTGETFPSWQPPGTVTVGTCSDPPFIPLEINKRQIVEAAKKIIKLLTGEVPIRCQDVAVYLSLEEWEYLEGRKDLYKGTMMEDQPLPLWLDGSSARNTPERSPSPCPPYSSDSTENDNFTIMKVEVKEEEEEEMDDEQWTEEEEISPHIPTDAGDDIMTENNENLKEKEGRLEEDTLAEIGAARCHRSNRKERNIIPPENEDGTGDASGENLTVPNLHPVQQSSDEASNPCNTCTRAHRSTHKPHSCFFCGKCFTRKSSLIIHENSHTGVGPYSCSLCGKCFIYKSHLLKHESVHTGVKPYSCSVCGKCFLDKSTLSRHERGHSGEKPYSCSLCGTCFTRRSSLIKHENGHTGQGAYSCSECGKCFTYKSHLLNHRVVHTGEKPYSCSKCGKCFSDKRILVGHERSHSGEKPYSCSICGKLFTSKASVIKHQNRHTGEGAYSCSECGKCFTYKSDLLRHKIVHTGVKPSS